MQLVVVESPSKAKTIEKYLGRDFKVIASKGHIIDLPKSDLGIDVKKDFKPEYVVTNPESLKNIIKNLKSASTLILAVDRDREGEAIGWHIARATKLINDRGSIINRKKKLLRIVFTEITKDAINESLKSPRSIDMNLVNAQQARRILDRLVGYNLSPLLWKKLVIGLSAGRVQSVAVRLIVDREDERNKFKSQEYWSLSAYVSKKSGKVKLEIKTSEPPKIDNIAEASPEQSEASEKEKLKAEKEALALKSKLDGLNEFKLVKIKGKNPELPSEKACMEISRQVAKKDWLIANLESKEVKRSPKPPFTTSTLQQTAANIFGMSSSRTMKIAQKLYETGLITYMRTDSLYLSKQGVNAAQSYINSKLGADYGVSGGRFYKSRGKLTQEAHEAIRPTSFNKAPNAIHLSADLQKLYTLVWQRALASQMADARLLASTVQVNLDEYQFQANGQTILFLGYLKIYPDMVKESALPKYTIGERVYPHLLLNEQHYTEPPARFTEASLIKELELNGIGRPFTFGPTISTILARRYVEKINKYLKPTDTGIAVTRLLVDHFPNIVDKDFTALLEEDLDKIAE